MRHAHSAQAARLSLDTGVHIFMIRRMKTAILLCACAALGAASIHAQTDVALSLYGAFSGTTNGNGTQQSPANAAGGMLELRHISNPLVGYDVTYSFNRANQNYSQSCSPSVTCVSISPKSISANAHELTADWVVSAPIANLRPFVLAGAGLLLNEPSGGQSNASSATKPVFVYGAGLDWGLLPHIGLRFQYRGNLYKAPGLTTAFSSTGRFTQTAEPMIGAYLRF
jgi:opacity protein-like surface antigen